MEAISGVKSSYNNDEAYEYKACLWASVGNLKRHHGIDLDKTERQSVAASLRDPRARIGFRWLKMKSSVHRDGEIVPYIENISMRNEMKYTKPDPYHLAELGIICALHGKNKGLMIRVFPKLNKLVLVYQIT